MLILLDRAFDANAFLREVAATGALLLARAKSTRHPAVLGHLPDGSYLSDLGGLEVRIIEASVTVTGADGSRVRGSYRLITTLMDHRRFPAAAVVRLYHERWEIESAYFALRHTLLNGHVLRSGDRPGLEQETWALLTLYQLLRMAMVTAVETRPGTDPDRASFTTAMEAAKDQLTAAAGICPDGPADLPGAIGRAVLATLLPARRLRFSARKVKCATSRYLNRDDSRPPHPAAITAIDITISTPPLDLKPGRTRRDRTHPPSAPAAHPAGADHRPHHQPAPARLERPRPRHPPATSNPETCSPSSASGHGWASSPAPASAPTASTRHPIRHPRQTRPILNFAALLRGTRLRRAVDPGASADPAGLTARARPEARPDRRAANLHRLPTAGSGPGRCGTSDSQVPGCPREASRRCRQEQHRPPDSLRCKGTPHERNGAKADQDDTSGNAHACERTEVAVLPWRDYALHAGSRGRCPPPAQTFRSGVVIRFVHRDASCQLWCRPPDHLSI